MSAMSRNDVTARAGGDHRIVEEALGDRNGEQSGKLANLVRGVDAAIRADPKSPALARWAAVADHIATFSTQAGVDAQIDALMARRGPVSMAFVNAHVMNLLIKHPMLCGWLRDTDLLLRDGVGVATLLRLIGVRPGLNLNGTDLIPRVVERAQGHDIALFGTDEPHLGRAADSIVKRHHYSPGKIVTASGFLDDGHYLDLCLRQRPRLVILGMGVPKQERVAALLKHELTHDCLIVCGGAILDFYAGRFARAPQALRRLNMEWAFRLLLEPTRLFGRYVIGNPLFLARVARLRMMSWTLSRRARIPAGNNALPEHWRGLVSIDPAEGLPVPVVTVPGAQDLHAAATAIIDALPALAAERATSDTQAHQPA